MRVATLVVFSVLVVGVALAQPGPVFTPGGGPWAPSQIIGETPDGTVFASDPAGLIASADGGLTWTLRAAGERLTDVEAAPDGRLWAVRADGVVTSADGGATWTLDGAFTTRAVALDGAVVYAATPTDVRRRTDAGWEVRALLPPPEFGTPTVRRLVARDGALAVAIFVWYDYSESSRIAHLAPGATEWTTTGAPGPVRALVLSDLGNVWIASTEGRIIQSPSSGRLDRWVPGATTRTSYATGDVGWLRLDADTVYYARNRDLHRLGPGVPLVLTSTPATRLGRFVLGPDRTVFDTYGTYETFYPDGGSAASAASGMYATAGDRLVHVGHTPARMHAVAFGSDGTLYAGGWAGTVHRLDGDGWVATSANLGFVRRFVSYSSGLIALGAGAADPATGAPWSFPSLAVVEGGDPPPWYFEDIADVAVFPTRTVLAAYTLFLGPRGGIVDPEIGADHPLLDVQDVRTLYVTSAGIGYAGANGPAVLGEPSAVRAWRSDDDGATWVPDGAGLDGLDVLGFADADGLFAATDDGVFRQGEDRTWVREGLGDRIVHAIRATPLGLLAATDDGLWRRETDGWARFGTGLDGRPVYDLAVSPDATPWIAVATDEGAWASQPLATVDDAPAPASPAVRLRAFPNPATTRLTLVHAPGADAEVLDAYGRRVARVTLGADGRATVSVTGLAAGVYTVRVGDGGTARVTVVR